MLDQVTTTLVTGTHWIRPQSDVLRAFKQVQIDADLARKQSRIDARGPPSNSRKRRRTLQ